MSQISFTDASLEELIRSAPVIAEVRARTPASSCEELPIHLDNNQFPPFKRAIEHYTVVSVIRGNKLEQGARVDVLPADTDSKLECHRACYLIGLGISSTYHRYRSVELDNSTQSKIVFLSGRADGRYEYVMFGAQEGIAMRSQIEALVAKIEAERNAGPKWPTAGGNVEPLLHDPFSGPGDPGVNQALSAKSSDEVFYPVVDPDRYESNIVIRHALRAGGDFQGIKLYAPLEVSLSERRLYVAGLFQHYVGCGAQYATWSHFPGAVRLTVHDFLTGEDYVSCDLSTMNVSPAQGSTDHYAELPCDQIVGRYFAIDLFAHVSDLPLTSTIIEVRASYIDSESDPLRISINAIEQDHHDLL